MIKLTLQNDWQPEDDMDAIVDKWIAYENAKIPSDIRESLRAFFPHIGISPDEADLIPASVAHHITMHSTTYRKYVKEQKESAQKSLFEQEFFARLQALYVVLEFYTAFMETLSIAKRANILYVKASLVKVKSGLLEEKVKLWPKTNADEEQLTLLVEIENALRRFENIVPVEIVKYVDYDSYQIPSDTLSTYRAVGDLVELPALKKQAEELFDRYGYIQTGRNTFAPKSINAKGNAFKREFWARLQELYSLLEFYAAFVESLLIAKRANDFYLKTCSIKISSGLLEKEMALYPKTKEEEQMLAFLIETEKHLRIFGNVMPVEVARYIGYDVYKISGDILSAYSIAAEMFELLGLKKQAEAFFVCMDTCKQEKRKG